MAFRVRAGNDDKSMSIDVAVSVTNGRVVVATVASASGVGRSGLEKRREVARKADVTAVNSGRAMILVNSSSSLSTLSRRAAVLVVIDDRCSRPAVTDRDNFLVLVVIVGVVNASAPMPRRDDITSQTVPTAATKQR